MMYGWSDTMVFGPVHWFLFIALVTAVLYPIGRILTRLGFSPLWSVLVFRAFRQSGRTLGLRLH